MDAIAISGRPGGRREREGTMNEITVVGGGLAGLVASIECAERGLPVRLLEARRELGGRARSTAGPFKANLGPHALYADGLAWSWLKARGLLPPVARPPLRGLRFRRRGRIRRTPPPGLARALAHRRLRAPADASFRRWAGGRFGAEVADALCGAAGVFTFDPDPGRLSAAFVWPRLLRVSALPPVARYPVGGWSTLVDRLVVHAERLGVAIETGTPVTEPPGPPVIVATELDAARRLLGDGGLRWEGGRALCLDLGLEGGRRGDPFAVSDLDEGAWIERFTAADPTLAPEGHELFQAQIGLWPDEPADAPAPGSAARRDRPRLARTRGVAPAPGHGRAQRRARPGRHHVAGPARRRPRRGRLPGR
jgi:phytoene dehydrogenase-like protein